MAWFCSIIWMRNGRPVFTANSNDTPVPIGRSTVNANGMIPDYSRRYEQLINENPLLDSVRRWVAPYDGTISISGGVQLVDTTQERATNNYTTADGVRVAIQHEASELWSARILAADSTVHTPEGVGSISVPPRRPRLFPRAVCLRRRL